ncbi:MAG: hypothetical protein U9Q70_06790 [Chloroflexota bacterium]|nr:hypothetical protein [Chloroflexota bacterium]
MAREQTIATCSLADELAYAEQFLRQPTVHLALDPEFVMAESSDIPGLDLGHITGPQINTVQAWLHKIALEAGEWKILVSHQFNDRMMGQKEELVDYQSVELVWDADGFGVPHAKIADYVQYAGEPGYEYSGLKLFYRYDQPLMSPSQVISLEPPPA